MIKTYKIEKLKERNDWPLSQRHFIHEAQFQDSTHMEYFVQEP
jgi:hypothetical protein